MSTRARAGLDAFLSRRTAPPAQLRSVLQLASGPLPLCVRRHATARRMVLRLAPDGKEARVTVPRWAPLREGAAFAQERLTWIEAQLAAVPRREKTGDGSMFPFRGDDLILRHHAAGPRQPRIEGGELHCGGPEAALAARIRRWLEGEALALMQRDCEHFCARLALPAPAVRLSRAQRRWGSCSATGTIRLNWRLVMAPDDVRLSVVSHEAAHLVHFDHSPAFHALHARMFGGDLAPANRWLKANGRTLYAHFG